MKDIEKAAEVFVYDNICYGGLEFPHGGETFKNCVKSYLAGAAHMDAENRRLLRQIKEMQSRYESEMAASEAGQKRLLLENESLQQQLAEAQAENESYRLNPEHQYQAVYQDLILDLGVQPGGSLVDAVGALQDERDGARAALEDHDKMHAKQVQEARTEGSDGEESGA